MQYRKLGHTELNVSLIGLGTMTWGEQNSEQQAHQQLDYALSRGINLIDTAEMYPVPPKAETQGLTERYIGSWLARSGQRSNIILATKAAGPVRQAHQPRHLRQGESRFDRRNLFAAVDDSLQRLQTDYIDLYQLHWPDRSTNTFGRLNYPWIEDETSVAIDETLSVLKELIQSGKIRHIGVSNETPWGVAQFLTAARQQNLPLIASIQNPYSLLNRTYEIGLSEFSHREGIGLLAYSPLAFGVLSGKYLNGQKPEGARLSLFDRFVRYSRPQATAAVQAYVDLARQHQLSPVQLALAFVNSRPFTTSNLIGATNLQQLKENIDSIELQLSPEVLNAIDQIHLNHPNPAP